MKPQRDEREAAFGEMGTILAGVAAAQTSAHGGHLTESIILEAWDALVKSQVNTFFIPF